MAKQLMSTELTINYDAVSRLLMTLMEDGLRESLDVMEKKAKKHAPVRDVFERTSNRRAEAVPRLKIDSAGRMRNRRYNTPQRQDAFMAKFRSQRAKDRLAYFDGQRMNVSSRDFTPTVGKRGERVRGELRTVNITDLGAVRFRPQQVAVEQELLPGKTRTGRRKLSAAQTRIASGSDYLKGGELARAQRLVSRLQGIDPKTGKRVPQIKGLDVTQVREAAGFASKSWMREENAQRLKEGRQALQLTSRQSAAAKLMRKTALHMSAEGTMTMGGRLRDEIFTGQIVKTANRMYGDVISPTEYAKYQEYGTSRHRAQPFMRPALYEMRRLFPVIMQRALREGSKKRRVA